MMDKQAPILFFDGVCNLCSSSVQFVLKRNSKGNIRFASLQSEFAKKRLASFNLPQDYLDSLVLLENGQLFIQSDAALRLCKHLNGLWPLFTIFLLVPRPLRDATYQAIAKRRYKWFGRSDSCWIPDNRWNDRFLDQQ